MQFLEALLCWKSFPVGLVYYASVQCHVNLTTRSRLMDCGGDSGDERPDVVVLSCGGIGETIAAFPDRQCDGVLQGALLGLWPVQ